jgi:hypothetical protein
MCVCVCVSITTLTSYDLHDPAQAIDFSPLQNLQIGSGAHPVGTNQGLLPTPAVNRLHTHFYLAPCSVSSTTPPPQYHMLFQCVKAQLSVYLYLTSKLELQTQLCYDIELLDTSLYTHLLNSHHQRCLIFAPVLNCLLHYLSTP